MSIRVSLVLCSALALGLLAACDSKAVTICNRMIDCIGAPCAIPQCEMTLGSFSDAELSQAASCIGHNSCGDIRGGVCGTGAADAAQRCCYGTVAGGCNDPVCNAVPLSDPWPPQCLGQYPSVTLCDWIDSCEVWKLVPGDSAALDEGGNFHNDACRVLARPYDDLSRTSEAVTCTQCLDRNPSCDDAMACLDSCDIGLVVEP